jgi:hypothetical protein
VNSNRLSNCQWATVVATLLLLGGVGNLASATELAQIEFQLLEIEGETPQACQDFLVNCRDAKTEKIDDVVRKAATTKGIRNVRVLAPGLLTVDFETFIVITMLEQEVTREFYLKPVRTKPPTYPEDVATIRLQFGYQEFRRKDNAPLERINYAAAKAEKFPSVLSHYTPRQTLRKDPQGNEFAVIEACLVKILPVPAEEVTQPLTAPEGLLTVAAHLLDAEGNDSASCQKFIETCMEAKAGSIDDVLRKASQVDGIRSRRTLFALALGINLSTPCRVLLMDSTTAVDLDLRADPKAARLELAFGYGRLKMGEHVGEDWMRKVISQVGSAQVVSARQSDIVTTHPDGTKTRRFGADSVLMVELDQN